ncbi:hypothetical protein E3V08_01170 [Candidatus Atribacteria bacterium MT.SAG.1]|nr:hypothetical protein E3V08_01170 [Candidatus Atribacteria bacterium MT.SAG.1]
MRRMIIKLILFFIFFALLIILCIPRSCAFASSPDSKEVDRIKVKIYFLISDEYCLNVDLVPVGRIVKNDLAEKLAWTVLEQLFNGPIEEDSEKLDLWTAIPKGVKVNSVEIDNGVARIDLSLELQSYGGGSFSVFYIREQIERTLKEFPSIEEVVITVEGKSEKDGVLQP